MKAGDLNSDVALSEVQDQGIEETRIINQNYLSFCWCFKMMTFYEVILFFLRSVHKQAFLSMPLGAHVTFLLVFIFFFCCGERFIIAQVALNFIFFLQFNFIQMEANNVLTESLNELLPLQANGIVQLKLLHVWWSFDVNNFSMFRLLSNFGFALNVRFSFRI